MRSLLQLARLTTSLPTAVLAGDDPLHVLAVCLLAELPGEVLLSFTMGENIGSCGELIYWAEVWTGRRDLRGVWMTLPGVSMARGEVGEGGQESGEEDLELSLHMSALNSFLLRVELERLFVSS